MIPRVRFVVLAALVAACSARDVAPEIRPLGGGPVLLVDTSPAAGPESNAADTSADDRATALALASITEADHSRIVDGLTYVSARLEARLSPLGDDLENDDPIDTLNEGVAPYLPALSAARALDAGAWTARDLSVRVASSCAAAREGETCVSLWDGANDKAADRAVAGRARFLAWSVAHAAVFELDDAVDRKRCVESLRAALPRSSSAVALVLRAEDLEISTPEERSALEQAARRLGFLMNASNKETTKELEAMARPAPTGRIAPWLQLSPTQVLVVPRLSALSHLGAFGREVQTAAGPAMRWVHRP